MSLAVVQVLVGAVSAVATTVAAVAAWRSASASRRTAASADQTSRRAVEALARFNKVGWSFYVNTSPPGGAQATQPGELFEVRGQAVMDNPVARAEQVHVEWRLRGGQVKTAHAPSMGGGRNSSLPVEFDEAIADPAQKGEVVESAVLTYPDSSHLGTWTVMAGPPLRPDGRLTLVNETFRADFG